MSLPAVLRIAALLAASLSGRPADAAAGRVLVARELVTYELPAGDRLAMPTDVAVGPGGEVYVADGVNRRVVQFRRDGTVARTLRSVAGQALANPVALATTDDGSLWIADNELGEVLVASNAPGLDRVIEVGGLFENDLELDLTGLAVSPDGSRLWLVDNDNDQVLRGDLVTGAWTAIGAQGDATGEMNYPSMAALSDDGALFVSDTLNGRVVGWSDDGRPTRPVGRYGVAAGQLYRPRGVAVGDGAVWVGDGVLGVVQAFGSGGRLLDVLRDEDKQILRFQNPAGLAVDGDHLFVVELGADRVRELRIQRVGGQPVVAEVLPPVGAPAAQGRECTACHLEMMPELAQHTGGALIDSPENRRGQPFVSSAESCLSCHDGTVLDSRRDVWVLHGHPVGKAPPDDMVIPEGLPLSEGELDCRTCHSAHTLGGSGQEHRNALMLRVTDQANELCVACHDAVGEEAHPTGQVDAAAARRIGMPADLAGVDCLSCHVAHGAPDDSMLTENARTNDCLTCHTRQARRKGPAEHPLGDKLDDRATVAAVVEAGRFVGEGGTVVCLSCHSIHVEEPAANTCATCHRQQSPVRGKELMHDTGKCLECHAVHEGISKVPKRAASAGDPTGCLSCHGSGGKHLPVDARPGTLGHALADRPGGPGQSDPPLEGCPSCHVPHGKPRPDAALCGECHDGQAEEQARGGHGGATCLDCHPAHEEPAMAEERPGDMNPVTRRCQACHSPDADSGDIVRVADYEHPAPNFLPDGQRWTPLGGLPLYSATGQVLPAGQNGDLTCGSCHLTHGPDRHKPGTALRRPGMEKPCAACHGTQALKDYLYFHDPEQRKSN